MTVYLIATQVAGNEWKRERERMRRPAERVIILNNPAAIRGLRITQDDEVVWHESTATWRHQIIVEIEQYLNLAAQAGGRTVQPTRPAGGTVRQAIPESDILHGAIGSADLLAEIEREIKRLRAGLDFEPEQWGPKEWAEHIVMCSLMNLYSGLAEREVPGV